MLISRYTKLVSLFVLTFLVFSCNPVHAFTPEWITHYTKGKVKYTEAEKIVRAVYLYSVKHEVNPNDVFKIIAIESTFNKRAKSKADGRGLMQVVRKWHKDKINKRDIFDLHVNIDVGTQIYKEYKITYKTQPKALRAYNGSHRSNKYVKKFNSVKLIDYDEPYPGSDDRPKILYLVTNKQEDEI